MIRVVLPWRRVRPEVGGVVHRDALGDDHGERDLGVDRLDDRGLGERRRHEDDATRRRRSPPSPRRREPKTGTLGAVEVDGLCRPCAGSRRRRCSVPEASIRRVCLRALGAGHALDDDLAVLGRGRSPSGPSGSASRRRARRPCRPRRPWCRPGHQRVVGLGEDPPALLDVVAVEPDDQRLGRLVAEHAAAPRRCRWRPRRRR